jgi:hypothetical protein
MNDKNIKIKVFIYFFNKLTIVIHLTFSKEYLYSFYHITFSITSNNIFLIIIIIFFIKK